MAGSLVGCNNGGSDASNDSGSTDESSANDATAEVSPLLEEPHVCRGLNTCKGLGASKDNDCAGLGTCASVTHHSCGGINECKGQGGCGQHPGENSCKGEGHCAVPLMKEAWPIARKNFEAAMTAAGKEFGEAPPAS